MGIQSQNVNTNRKHRGLAAPDIAYKSNASEYLVVWVVQSLPMPTEFHSVIYSQLLSADGVGIDSPSQFTYSEDPYFNNLARADVEFNRVSDEFLIVYNLLTFGPDEDYGDIYGQRVPDDGTDGAAGAFRISDLEACMYCRSISPSVTANDSSGEYMVVWQSEDPSNNEFEIFGRRIDPPMFKDDFESGDLGRWSAVVGQ